MKSISNLALLVGLGLSMTAVQAQAPSCGSNTDPFPATGQTESYPAYTLNGGIPVQDDGAVRAGGALSYTGTGPTIIDNNTGLEWEVLGRPDPSLTISADGVGGIHDFRTTYWWSCPNVAGVAACLDHISIWDKVWLMNGENGGVGYAGHNDWRVPNIKELHSIVDFEAKSPAVDSAFNTGSNTGVCDPDSNNRCSFTQSSTYWSSTTEFNDSSDAWGVYFYEGRTENDTKNDNTLYVRLVRGGCVAGARPGQ
jgi:uncharacterized protein DUF1566